MITTLDLLSGQVAIKGERSGREYTFSHMDIDFLLNDLAQARTLMEYAEATKAHYCVYCSIVTVHAPGAICQKCEEETR